MASLGALMSFLSLLCVSHALFDNFFGTVLLGDLFPSLATMRCRTGGRNLTNFLHYSRHHLTNSRVLVTGNRTDLKLSEFAPVIPTKMIIHGFLDNIQISDWMIKMKTELLMEGDYNVIIVDWSCGNGMPYSQAVENAKKAGVQVADLIAFLQDTTGADPMDFHLIGHSLGSQVAAIVGQRIQNIGRITGLDPAGPRFYDAPLDQRLDPTDAKFVDVIHTDAGSALFEGLGMHEQIGHIDFYPNGGRTQPGCHSSPFEIMQRMGLQRAARYYITCDHFRAVDFFVASIRKGDCDYVGVTCRNWETFSEGRCANCSERERCALMGFHSDDYLTSDPDSTAKEFYLKTSEHNPFCLYQYQVIVNMGSNNSDEYLPMQNIILHLGLKTQKGTYEDFKLDSINEVSVEPEKTYAYLMTSPNPVGDVDSANLVWKRKPLAPWKLQTTPAPIGRHLKFKKLQIVPIRMTERASRDIKSKLNLCAPQDAHVAEGERLEFSEGTC